MRSIRSLSLSAAGSSIVELGIQRPRLVVVATVLITIVLAAATLLVEIDTDPENMLPGDDPVRVLNQSMREDFGTADLIAVGIVDESGVLTPQTLGATAALVDGINALDGVMTGRVVSFASATDVPSRELSQQDVENISAAVNENALFAGTVISPDEQGLAVYVPLTSKDKANSVASSIKELLRQNELPETVDTYIAGLPLAEEAFGRDMFFQMGLLAPLAGLLIFLLMLFFFRRLSLVLPAMAVAMLSVIWTMGLLIGTGFTVHIMASMIPIFLMPIAILDSVHILSEFFDRYPKYQNRQDTLRAVYRELFTPITYTTLTTAAAFGFLAVTPIPPVQVFGIFVAVGVVIAWLLTMLFIPAFVMLRGEDAFAQNLNKNIQGGKGALAGGLRWVGSFATNRAVLILPTFVVLAAVAVPGVLQISVNDNPVRWFKPGSEIRVATEVFNEHFPGTYNTSLLLEAGPTATLLDPAVAAAVTELQGSLEANSVVGQTTSYVDAATTESYFASGRDEAFRAIPGSRTEIEASLESAAASSKLAGVSSLITSDFQSANIRVLMNNGDNQAMQSVVDNTESYLKVQPLPAGVSASWAGETYLNLVWQDKMVNGMLVAFLSTFAVVFVLMVLLFRSVRWAILAMAPMTVTILLVYGTLGFAGKDYDMPLAILSTLVLGIGVDFAIHFIQRYRELLAEVGSPQVALERFFEEPARALTRNALIIAIGFVPLLFASLVPYIVVGVLLASIMLLSWLTTLLLLPSVIAVGEKFGGR